MIMQEKQFVEDMIAFEKQQVRAIQGCRHDTGSRFGIGPVALIYIMWDVQLAGAEGKRCRG